jgi:pimeloyl-ACP methyl ester carboxylesterase
MHRDHFLHAGLRLSYLDSGLLGHLGVKAAIFLGNSLGGVNAYRFASRHPAAVRALVIEDIGVRFVELDAGHAVHVDAPAAVAAEVRAFAHTI